MLKAIIKFILNKCLNMFKEVVMAKFLIRKKLKARKTILAVVQLIPSQIKIKSKQGPDNFKQEITIFQDFIII